MSDSPIIDGMVTAALVGSIGTIQTATNIAVSQIERASQERRNAQAARLETSDAQSKLAMAERQIAQMQDDIDDLTKRIEQTDSINVHKILNTAYEKVILELRTELEMIRNHNGVQRIHEEVLDLRFENEQLKKNHAAEVERQNLLMDGLRREVKEWMATQKITLSISLARKKRLGFSASEKDPLAEEEVFKAAESINKEYPELSDTAIIKDFLTKRIKP
ncbi:MAG: hypothetical protein WCG34_13410 [Leptolinea sp.]